MPCGYVDFLVRKVKSKLKTIILCFLAVSYFLLSGGVCMRQIDLVSALVSLPLMEIKYNMRNCKAEVFHKEMRTTQGDLFFFRLIT